MHEYAEVIDQAEREQEDEILTGYLKLKRDEKEIAKRIEALYGPALAILQKRGRGFAAPELGALKVIDVSARTIVDLEAVQRILAKHHEELPTKEAAGGGPRLRADLV